jgi:hypothetical protein
MFFQQSFTFLCLIGSILIALNEICPVLGQQSVPGVINLGKSSSGISIKDNPNYSTVTGYEIDDLGDINGDGYGDIGIQSNCVYYIIYGSYSAISIDLASLTTSTGFSISGEIISENCALQTMAAIGDINGDKFNDILIGMGSVYGSSIAPLYYVILGALSTSNINLDDLSGNYNVLTILGPWVEIVTATPTSSPSPLPTSFPTPHPTSYPTPLPTSHPVVSTISPTIEPSSFPTSADFSSLSNENSETLMNYMKSFPKIELKEEAKEDTSEKHDNTREPVKPNRRLQATDIEDPIERKDNSHKHHFSYSEIPFPFSEKSVAAEQRKTVRNEARASVIAELHLSEEAPPSVYSSSTRNIVEEEVNEESVDTTYYAGYCYDGCCYENYYFVDNYLEADISYYYQSVYLGISGECPFLSFFNFSIYL